MMVGRPSLPQDEFLIICRDLVVGYRFLWHDGGSGVRHVPIGWREVVRCIPSKHSEMLERLDLQFFHRLLLSCHHSRYPSRRSILETCYLPPIYLNVSQMNLAASVRNTYGASVGIDGLCGGGEKGLPAKQYMIDCPGGNKGGKRGLHLGVV